jgi:CheY-like chemotaxis protein
LTTVVRREQKTPSAFQPSYQWKGLLFWHTFVAQFFMSKKGPIILIEDDLDDQEILRDVFQELKVQNELRFFADCDAAYNHLMSSEEKPFLILSDINLPKMSGVELKKKIDETDSLRRKSIPFLFLTTSNNPDTVGQAYRITNLQGYFQKSDTITDLKEKVKLIVDYWSTALHPKDG